MTLDKKPLPGAYVEFIPGTARKSTGVTDANGVYKLQYDHETSGAVLGSHRVTINTGAHLADMPETAKPESIPVKYNEKSTLTAEVKQGENKIDFDLTSD